MCPLIYSKFAYAISVNEISSPDLVCMQRIKSMQIYNVGYCVYAMKANKRLWHIHW